MKTLKFLERLCDVFKVAHWMAFAFFTMMLVSAIDVAGFPFLRTIGAVLYSGGAGALFMILQALIEDEIRRSEDAETSRALYNVFRDCMIDNDRQA